MKQRIILVTLLTMLAACSPKELQPDAAFECSNCERWNEPQEPFRIYGNTWYVGTSGLSSLLVETADGLILIDGWITAISRAHRCQHSQPWF